MSLYRSLPIIERTKDDGAREVVIMVPSGAPVWLEGEPEWHGWLIVITCFVILPLCGVGWLVWLWLT